MAAHEGKSWSREIVIGVAIAVLSAVALAGMGLDRSGGRIDGVPGASPASESSRLVGTWMADVVENGRSARITWRIRPDGISEYLFSSGADYGQDYGTWQYTDGVVFERFSNGASGKGAIRWIDANHMELTILDNGVPLLTGVKRHYFRQ